MTNDDYKWKMSCPSNVLIAGSSGSGKSTFVEKLLKTKDIWEKPFDNLTYCYGINTETVQRISNDHPEATIIEGMPRNLEQPEQMFSPSQRNVLILDDLSSETQNSKAFTNMLTRGSHHLNVCVISIEHFLYSQSKERRLQSPHWHQILLFQNQRSLHQIATLARQSSVSNPKTIEYAFRSCTDTPYGYLIIDFRNDTCQEMRLITNVFCEKESPVYVFL